MNSIVWKDRKGRKVEVHTMSNRWLKNIKKFLPLESPVRKEIVNEIKRRKAN